MPTADDPGYTPKPIDARDLRVTVTAPLKRLPKDVRDEVLDRRRAEDERFRPLAPRVRQRIGHHVLGAVVFFPLLTFLVTPLGLGTLLFQVPLAAAYGLLMAAFRPAPFAGGFLLLAVLWTCLLLDGRPIVSVSTRFLVQVCTALLYYALGYAVAATIDRDGA